MAIRKALAGGLIRLAHSIYPPKVTMDKICVGDTWMPIEPLRITVGGGAEGGGSTRLRVRGVDGSVWDVRGYGGGGGGTAFRDSLDDGFDDGPTPVRC